MHRYLVLAVIAISFLASVVVANSADSAVAQQSSWTESWQDDSWKERWFPIGMGHQCSKAAFGMLVQDCQSAAVQTYDRFSVSQHIEFRGTMLSTRGANSTTSNNLAHHVLLGADDGTNGQYCGLYISHDVAAGNDKVFYISYPYSAQIGTAPHKTHDVKIVWEPISKYSGRQYGYCYYYVDGTLLRKSYYSFTLADVALWKGASSVSPGQGNDGSYSHAEHGAVTVTLSLPSPTPVPCKWWRCK